MIQYTKGNLLDDPSEALINTVNTMGIMGKGIALQFKELFPYNYKKYVEACKLGSLKPGQLLIVNETNLYGDKIIINFPTKVEWYKKSRYEFIEAGLNALVNVLNKGEIKSIAIPPLGCGNGGLQWEKVKTMIEEYLREFQDIKITVYEPNDYIGKQLKTKCKKNDIGLTPPRAMLLYSLFYYESFGEPVSLFVANKLAWFLQRMGEKLNLTFKPHHYGPYSVQVGHVLHALNGKYILGLEQMNAKPFEQLELKYETFIEIKKYVENELSDMQQSRLKNLLNFLDGFQTAFSLELLSTIDYLKEKELKSDVESIRRSINLWSDRKKELFKIEYIQIALEHLNKFEKYKEFNIYK